jgi:uncharacterized SAM-binding protein YcdF (DUF218 family)
MAYVKAFLGLGLLLLCLVVVLFVDFTYTTFALRPRDVSADAIVVLAGGRGRVEEGIRLYQARRAQWLFLIGVDPSVRKAELYQARGNDRDASQVLLEQYSRNTLENAIYSRDLVAKHKVRSICLITSRYHMKRAVLIFRSVLPKDIAVYPLPVDSKNLKERWWSHGGSFRLLSGEFYKYCLFRVFFIFAPGELRAINGGR